MYIFDQYRIPIKSNDMFAIIPLTPGNSYDDIDNCNKSSLHWDMVLIQRPEWGGGEIWFDNRLIRKDGRFVIPELESLNPEQLV